jgi:uncharacterized protein (TIGR02246 family)
MANKSATAAAAAIRQLDAAFMKAAAARDAKALVSAFYAPDAVLMPPGAPIVKGRASIQKFLQGLLDAGATQVKLRTTKVDAAGDLAYGRGAYSFSLPAGDASTRQEVGKYVVVYRRRAGAWRAVADIFNGDAPAS